MTTKITSQRVLSFFIMILQTGHSQVCLTGFKDGPPLPTSPYQFLAEIKANFNLTLHVTTYCDNINQCGHI